MSKVPATRIFLSYSWDSEVHKDRVLALTQRLRDGGLDAWIDRFTPFPAQGWPRWMQDEITCARFVLCVVTKAYADRFLGHSAASAPEALWHARWHRLGLPANRGQNKGFPHSRSRRLIGNWF